MSNVCAGIGRGQMKVLADRIEQRRKNYLFYKEALSDIEAITVSSEPSTEYFSNHWLTSILLDTDLISREDVRLGLISDNIDCRPLWKPMHLQPVFEDAQFYGDGTSEKLFDKGLCLPSGSNLTNDDLHRVVNNIRQTFVIKQPAGALKS